MAASEEVQGQLEPAMAQSESRSGLLLRFSRIDGVCQTYYYVLNIL